MPKLIIAKNAGFCPGVKQAIDQVLELSKKTGKKIYTLGPLIHNKEVIKSLEEKNIFSVEKAEDIKEENAILVIRAHGIAPSLEEKIRSLNLQVIDGTCALVKSVHRNISRYREQGYHTVIVGDKDHAEVIGLKGYAGEKCSVISSPDEAAALKEMDKVNLVSQTTQEEEIFLACAEALKKKCRELVISNTICNPTRLRQRETFEMSAKADLVIVVGGRHSANTARLYDICARISRKAVLIEKPDELEDSLVRSAENIFITAGASTPNWLIEATAERVRSNIFPKSPSEKAWKLLLNSGIYTGLAAAFFTLASAKFLGVYGLPKKLIFSSGMFILSLHVLNRATSKNSQETDEIKNLLFVKFASLSRLLAYLFGAGSLFLAYLTDPRIFFSMGIFWLIAVLYPYGLSGYIQKIPGSKDFVLAFGWTFACALMPVLNFKSSFTRGELFFCLFAFFISMIRSILLSIAQSHNDLLVGKENIYKSLGEKFSYTALYFLTFIAALSLYLSGSLEKRKLLTVFIFFGYQFLLVIYFRKGKIPDKLNSEALIDLSFIILGITAV